MWCKIVTMTWLKPAVLTTAIAVAVGTIAVIKAAIRPFEPHRQSRIITQILRLTSVIALILFPVFTWGILLTRTNFVQTLKIYDWYAHDVVMLRLLILLGAAFTAEIFLLTEGITAAKRGDWKALWAEVRLSVTPLTAVVAAALFLTAIVIAKTGVGIRELLNWYEAGVPILGAQMAVAVLLVLILPAIWNAATRANFRLTDLVVSLLIWAGASLWWINTPHAPSFFLPSPTPPTYQPYPYSDAAAWDAAGWALLLGMHPNPALDHLGFSGLLAIGHLIVKLDYARLANLQAAFLALLPVGAYWVGKALKSRTAGFAAAWLVAAEGVNALQSGAMLNHVSPKSLMTEYPTALTLVLLTLTLTAFGQAETKKQSLLWLLPLGAVLGVGIMIRYSVLALVPAVVLGVIILRWKRWKEGLAAAVLVLLITLVTLAPWMWRSEVRLGSPWFFMNKTKWVFISPNYRTEPPKVPSAQSKREVGTTTLVAYHTSREVRRASTPASVSTAKPNKPNRIVIFTKFFAHNLTTSFLTLPLTPRFADLKETVRTFPFFNRWWFTPKGGRGFTKSMWLFTVLYLLMLALGIATAYRHAGISGWVPLGVMLTYHAATAFAHTGGGRYLVPVQWVLFLYLALGLAEIARWLYAPFGAIPNPSAAKPPLKISTAWALGLTLPWMALILWMGIRDAITPAPYPSVAQVRQNALKTNMPYPKDSIQKFLKQPKATALEGFALYPRFFKANEGIPEGKFGYRVMPYNRLAFTLLHPSKDYAATASVIFPTSDPSLIAEGSGVLILGCWIPPQRVQINGVSKRVAGYIKAQAFIQNREVYTAEKALIPCPKH